MKEYLVVSFEGFPGFGAMILANSEIKEIISVLEIDGEYEVSPDYRIYIKPPIKCRYGNPVRSVWTSYPITIAYGHCDDKLRIMAYFGKESGYYSTYFNILEKFKNKEEAILYAMMR